MRNHLEKVLNVIGHAYPAIHRSQIRKYFPSSGKLNQVFNFSFGFSTYSLCYPLTKFDFIVLFLFEQCNLFEFILFRNLYSFLCSLSMKK